MDQLDLQKVALRYARAIVEAAQETGQLDKVTDSLRQLNRIYAEVPALRDFLENPGIPHEEKKAILDTQFKPGVAPLVGNLLSLLADNDRLAVLPEILRQAQELIDRRDGVAKAYVTVPVSLPSKLENQLSSTLEKMFGYQRVELDVTIDPALLAGAVVRIGDKIIDGSYHGKLEALRRQVG